MHFPAPASLAPDPTAPPPRPDDAALALMLQAALLDAADLSAAGLAWVRLLAQGWGAGARVALALLDDAGDRSATGAAPLALLAVSDGSHVGDATIHHQRLLAACGECLDQAAAVAWPEPASLAALTRIPRITLAHQALAEGGAAVLSVPLLAHGRAVGAVCVQWPEGAHPLPVNVLQSLAAMAGPVLALLQARQQPWHQRARAALRHAWAAPGQPRQRAWRRAGGAGAALLLIALCVPLRLEVGGQARLEGAVQRVLTAPADGFVQQVHARPGDHVQAGQALLELADQDLQLARQRWQSQLAQHLDALAAAQARADRGQLVQQQSQADEAQAELDLVEQQLQRARLVAPFDAVVVQGDLSQQLGTPVKLGAELMTLAPAGAYRVIVAVDERDIAHIAVGQPGTLALSALPWDTLALRVTRISPVALAVAGRNVFEVEATLLQPRADGLRPGLQGQAQISAGRASTLWRWSRRAIEALRLGLWSWWP